ncbi:MAG TPA: phosphoribosyltransferase [Myxococcota bacterium]|nr:phosphoribosyltransferase [Myxococcota bacterium]
MAADLRTLKIVALTMLLAVSLTACSERRSRDRETVPWEDVVKGLSEPPGSAGYSIAMLSLTRSWKQHGQEGAVLMIREGLELIGLSANGAIHGASAMLDADVVAGEKNMIGFMLASLSGAAEMVSDEWFRYHVHLTAALGVGGGKQLQDLLDMADAGTHELAESVRLCLALPLSNALIAAASSLPTERGRVLLERLPGWPSPPTTDLMQTLFPANLARISRWISEGRKHGGLHELAWTNVASRMEKGLARRLYDLPLVVDAEPRKGTPVSAIGAGYTPLEVARIMKDGVAVYLRPVLQWDKAFMTVVSGDATWRPGKPDDAAGDVSVATLAERLKALHELTGKLEKGVYPTLVGTGMGDRAGRSILIAVDSDATAGTMVEALRALAAAGYSDFRIATPGAPGTTNPIMVAGSTGMLSTDRTVRVFLTPAGASIFPNPAAGLASDNLSAGVSPIGPGSVGYFAAWDAERGFSSSLAMAFQDMGAVGAGHVEVAEIFLTAGDPPAMMLVDVASELQAAPGIQFSRIEPNFPGMICPQGRSCPGVVPVFGGTARVPAGVK